MKTFCGSAEFAAPELFHRDPNYGPGIDVWGFGVILFTMTLGHLPFELDREQPGPTNMHNLIRTISSGLTVDQKREMITCLSLDCCLLIEKCLDLNFETRISVREITLDDWITGGGCGQVDFLDPVLDQALLRNVASNLKENLKLSLTGESLSRYQFKKTTMEVSIGKPV